MQCGWCEMAPGEPVEIQQYLDTQGLTVGAPHSVSHRFQVTCMLVIAGYTPDHTRVTPRCCWLDLTQHADAPGTHAHQLLAR